MDWRRLFAAQKEFDERIVKTHELEKENLLIKKILALQVEVSEFCNETRVFKYWSKKDPSSKSVRLEEFVDGLHFIISIGNDLKVMPFLINSIKYNEATENGIEGKFMKVNYIIAKLYQEICDNNKQNALRYWVNLFSHYIGLGLLTGFTLEEMEEGYMQKNSKNHMRQDSGVY